MRLILSVSGPHRSRLLPLPLCQSCEVVDYNSLRLIWHFPPVDWNRTTFITSGSSHDSKLVLLCFALPPCYVFFHVIRCYRNCRFYYHNYYYFWIHFAVQVHSKFKTSSSIVPCHIRRSRVSRGQLSPQAKKNSGKRGKNSGSQEEEKKIRSNICLVSGERLSLIAIKQQKKIVAVRLCFPPQFFCQFVVGRLADLWPSEGYAVFTQFIPLHFITFHPLLAFVGITSPRVGCLALSWLLQASFLTWLHRIEYNVDYYSYYYDMYLYLHLRFNIICLCACAWLSVLPASDHL